MEGSGIIGVFRSTGVSVGRWEEVGEDSCKVSCQSVSSYLG